jgi:hypothetical protein
MFFFLLMAIQQRIQRSKYLNRGTTTAQTNNG